MIGSLQLVLPQPLIGATLFNGRCVFHSLGWKRTEEYQQKHEVAHDVSHSTPVFQNPGLKSGDFGRSSVSVRASTSLTA